jgi:Domain of unknown function (DUF4331)
MKKLSLVAALLAIAIAVPLSLGSSHREAPLSSLDPTGDDTDVYAFTANDAKDSLTVVANWIPFEDPAGGPNFYRFDDRAHYYINIDNDGDGTPDVRYLFKFKTKVENPNSFLYAAPPVNNITDETLNVKQFYDVYRITDGKAKDSRKGKGHRHHKSNRGHHRGKAKHHRKGKHHRRGRASHNNPRVVQVANDLPVAPNNVGPKTMPDYDKLAQQAIEPLPGGGKVFAGQRDDPFFVDLGATFDAINMREGGVGKDDLAGYSVHSIALQVPEQRVTKDRDDVSSPDADNAVVGVWASTERQKLQVTDNGDEGGKGDYVQVSRLGNPLVNEVVIPLGTKDRFNRTRPADDGQYADFVLKPELAHLLNVLFPDLPDVKETERTDIVQALLQGIPGLNQQTGKPVDTIKLNLGTDPVPVGTEKRLTVLADPPDAAGFPNGRRLGDDVVDVELRVVGGWLVGNKVALGDGVDENDKPFLSAFPYVAAPTSGLDAALKCGAASLPSCARTAPEHLPE